MGGSNRLVDSGLQHPSGPRAVSQLALERLGINVLKGEVQGTKGPAREFIAQRNYTEGVLLGTNVPRIFEPPQASHSKGYSAARENRAWHKAEVWPAFGSGDRKPWSPSVVCSWERRTRRSESTPGCHVLQWRYRRAVSR